LVDLNDAVKLAVSENHTVEPLLSISRCCISETATDRHSSSLNVSIGTSY